MIQINLIPDVKLELIKTQRSRNLVISIATIVTIASIAAVVLLAMYVFGAQLLRDNILNRNIDENYNTLKNVEDIDKIVTIQNQLTQIDETHNQKAMTSRIFTILSVVSGKGTEYPVSVTTFDFNKEDNSITLTAETDQKGGSDGFNIADVFAKNVAALKFTYKEYDENGKVPTSKESESDPVQLASNITISEIANQTRDEGGQSVTFQMTFNYDPEFLNVNNYIESITGVEKGNLTDSYKRLPSNLFTEKKSNSGGQQ